MGDKTQIATIAMAAHYATPLLVVIGTTLGMLIADVPAVFVGDKLASKIPMKLVHSIAAAIFALLGIATLLGAGRSEEHTSELQSLMRISYAVFCLKKKK